MVEKKETPTAEENESLRESRWRTGRLSLRIHPDLKTALEFLAQKDRRSLSQIVEIALVDYVSATLRNKFDTEGALIGDKQQELVLRNPHLR